MEVLHGVFSLKGVVQFYSWGGYEFIPDLLGIENKERKPYAEYWLGAHPNHPSKIPGQSLPQLIGTDLAKILGADVAEKFAGLPFLLKVLDVRQMLSIQVHPSKQSAARGFEEENKKGIPVNAPNRNYKDANHKPEMMVALGDFWLLHGFKKETELVSVLERVPELVFLKEVFIAKGYKALYEEVMLMDQGAINTILQPLVERILPLYESGKLEKHEEDFWAARAAANFCREGNYDKGTFSIYFFNLVHLKKGEGIFQAAGLPHAYLEGQNIELMANSDNVLRAGLTDKYIDVQELMKHVKFEATIPNILRSHEPMHKAFQTPAEEFELHQYLLQPGKETRVDAHGPEIILLIEGALELHTDEANIKLKKGDALFIAAGTVMRLLPRSEINLFRAIVPGI